MAGRVPAARESTGEAIGEIPTKTPARGNPAGVSYWHSLLSWRPPGCLVGTSASESYCISLEIRYWRRIAFRRDMRLVIDGFV